MPSPTPRSTVNLRQVVARNLKRLLRERGWSQRRLHAQLLENKTDISMALVNRLAGAREEATDDAVERKGVERKGDLRLTDLLSLARALDISPMTLLLPAAGDRVSLGFGAQAPSVPARRFREWLVGVRPLQGMDEERFYAALPAGLTELDEAHEVQRLASEAAWAVHDSDLNYAQAAARLDELKHQFLLLLERMELAKRGSDRQGYANFTRQQSRGGGG